MTKSTESIQKDVVPDTSKNLLRSTNRSNMPKQKAQETNIQEMYALMETYDDFANRMTELLEEHKKAEERLSNLVTTTDEGYILRVAERLTNNPDILKEIHTKLGDGHTIWTRMKKVFF